jgi:hypothetical protein
LLEKSNTEGTWDFTQRIMAVSYRRFGTTYPAHLKEPTSPRSINKIKQITQNKTNVPEMMKHWQTYN